MNPRQAAEPESDALALRRICICVDDFGLHTGVNKAALRLATMERVHAIGCMVGGPAWAEWGDLLRHKGTEGVDVGLHLDLTEHPLGPDGGHPLRTLIAKALLGALDRTAIRAEIRAQLDAFERMVRTGPAFVDGHQHVHQLPVVREELVDELQARYGGALPWLRSTRRAWNPQTAALDGWRGFVKPWGIETLGARALARLAARHGLLQNQRLLGVYDFRGGAEGYRKRLAGWLAVARDGDLLMCHPSAGASEEGAMSLARQAEFAVLASPGFAEMLRDFGISLRRMRKILNA